MGKSDIYADIFLGSSGREGEARSVGAIEDVIYTLTPSEEGILRLFYGIGVERWSCAEIARYRGCSRANVYQQRRRGLRKLRRRFRASILLDRDSVPGTVPTS